jgi:hypothetical protein
MKNIYLKLFVKLLVSLPLLFSGVLMVIGAVAYLIESRNWLGVLGIVGGVLLIVISFKLFKWIYPKEIKL